MARLKGGVDVRVEETADVLYTAIDQAAPRLGQGVARTMVSHEKGGQAAVAGPTAEAGSLGTAWSSTSAKVDAGMLAERAAGARGETMRVGVFGHGVELTERVRLLVEGRVLSALGQFGPRVGHVTVRLHRPADDGGDLCSCHIVVDLMPSGGLAVGETRFGLPAALDRAVGRAVTAVARNLAVRRERHDSRATAYAPMSE